MVTLSQSMLPLSQAQYTELNILKIAITQQNAGQQTHMDLRRIISYAILATPRFLNVAIAILFVPLMYQFWGDGYSLYVTVGALAGFATAFAQPMITLRYDKNEKLSGCSDASFILVFSCMYIAIFLPITLPYLVWLNKSPMEANSRVTVSTCNGVLL